MIIKNARIFDGNFNLIDADIAIDGGIITAIGQGLTGDKCADYSSCTVLPGFIDIHIHGCNAADTTDCDDGSVQKMSQYLVTKGVTSFCPTTMTIPLEDIRRSLRKVKAAMGSEKGAYIHGVNMEGPFISHAKKGAQDAASIIAPDLKLFAELCEICPVKLVDVAPEVEGALDFIKAAKEICTVSAAHTAADYAAGTKGINAGISHATHLYNAMSPVTSREAGMVGAVLDSGKVDAELICDGIHISAPTLRITFRLLGEDRTVVISDCMMAGGLADGEYSLGGQKVFVKNGCAKLADGTIAGSTVNLFDEFKNLLSFGIPLKQAVKSCTINPAKSIGVQNLTGSIEVGKSADLLITDNDFSQIKAVFVKGKKALL